MQPEIQNMDGTAPSISGPKDRRPNAASPEMERSHDANYFTSDKDFSKFSDASPADVNKFHTRSDVDTGPLSQHHTLGNSRNQSATGSHIHDGKSGLLIGTGMNLTISGSKGGNAALTSLIAMLKNVVSFVDNTT